MDILSKQTIGLLVDLWKSDVPYAHQFPGDHYLVAVPVESFFGLEKGKLLIQNHGCYADFVEAFR